MPMFGWDSKDLPEQEEKHQPDSKSDFAIDPALRNDSPLSSLLNPDKRQNDISSIVNHSPPSSSEEKSHSDDNSMPHRVEPLSMSSPHRRHHFDSNHRLPSPPPPVTSLSASHSPSPSVTSADRSSISTPPVRRSPSSIQPPPPLYSTYHHDPSMMQSNRHHSESHFSARAEPMHHPAYIYTHPPPPPFDSRYEHHHPTHSPYHTAAGLPHHFAVPVMPHGPGNPMRDNYGHPYPLPGQAPVTIIHTDDAATKLSDRVRRRCFNCCTTDTSTWRRSNLSPGKVLCNKCGLFERTHSRPRPDQFPHKRGPLATASLRGRTPPGGGGSLSSSPSMAHPNHPQQPPGQNMNQLPPISAPYHYTHTPLAPLSTTQDRREYQSNTLPALQAWHASPSAGGHGNGGDSNTGSPHMGPPSSASSRRPTIDASPTVRHVSPSLSSRSGNTSQESASSLRAPPPAQSSSSSAAPRESAHDE